MPPDFLKRVIFSYLKIFILFLCISLGQACMHVCIPGIHKRQMRSWDLLDLEVQSVVTCHAGAAPIILFPKTQIFLFFLSLH